MNTLGNKNGQSGMTYMGMLFLLIIIAMFAVVLVKVVPLYLGNFKVQSILKSLAEEKETAGSTPGEIEKRILARLSIDDVDNVTKEHIKISRESGKLVITVNYESRVPLFLNLDVVAKFDANRVELLAP